jgi:hypothetical protein
MKLTSENASLVAHYARLTGLTRDAVVNWFLTDYFKEFEADGHLEETIRSMPLRGKESAERVQTWLIERLSKRYDPSSVETTIRTNGDGTFGVELAVRKRAVSTRAPSIPAAEGWWAHRGQNGKTHNFS